MNFSVTTFCGIVGAVALAVSNVAGIPDRIRLFCVALSAACVAALGYHAQDRSNKPPAGPGTLIALFCGVVLMAACGCRVGGLGVSVASPTFGSVAISLDGGVIGHGRVPTNAPTPVAAPL